MNDEAPSGGPRFAIDLIYVDQTAVITMSGELDISNAPLLHECVRQAMDAGSAEIICDVANVTYMDSTGLSVFLMAHKRMSRQKGTFVVQSPPPVIDRLLHVSGLLPYLTVRSVPPVET